MSEPLESGRNRTTLLLVFSMCAAAGMLFFVTRVWAPGKSLHFSDLYARWYGSREILLHQRDPYGADVSREIQLFSYGHQVVPKSVGGHIEDENRFAYPLYIVFVLAPFVGLSFSQTHEIFCVLLPLISLATIYLWMTAVRWRVTPLVAASVVLLSMANFPMLESITLQQPVLLAAVFIAGAFAALASDKFAWAGVLLALATIKPQVTVLLVPWLLLWACCELRHRRKLLLGFTLCLGSLFLGAEWLLPGWISEFRRGLAAYQHYTGNFSILTLVFGKWGGLFFTVALLAAVIWLAWRTRHAPFGSPSFNFMFSCVVVSTLIVSPTMYPTGQVLLLPIFYLIGKNAGKLWAEGPAIRLVVSAISILVVWPWLAAFSMLLLHAALPNEELRAAWLVVLAPVLLTPVSILALLGMRLPVVVQQQPRDGYEVANQIHVQ